MSTTPPPAPGIAQFSLLDRQRLPGLIPQEIVIFKAWWALHNAEYTAYDFNVRVGKGYDPGPDLPDDIRKSAIDSTRKRIDAVLWKGNQPYIIEVKVRATPPVIGQMVCYRLLWMQQNPDKPQPFLKLLYCMLDEDTKYCLDQLQIPYDMVFCDLRSLALKKA